MLRKSVGEHGSLTKLYHTSRLVLLVIFGIFSKGAAKSTVSECYVGRCVVVRPINCLRKATSVHQLFRKWEVNLEMALRHPGHLKLDSTAICAAPDDCLLAAESFVISPKRRSFDWVEGQTEQLNSGCAGAG